MNVSQSGISTKLDKQMEHHHPSGNLLFLPFSEKHIFYGNIGRTLPISLLILFFGAMPIFVCLFCSAALMFCDVSGMAANVVSIPSPSSEASVASVPQPVAPSSSTSSSAIPDVVESSSTTGEAVYEWRPRTLSEEALMDDAEGRALPFEGLDFVPFGDSMHEAPFVETPVGLILPSPHSSVRC
jgi:hypothetical protein